ncbi:hypothetical protein TPY_2691 [Sulfobacillus acidophilus TPY]|nr:hypothetical protein TPY_2691 [Sulfobacillus acidophilus TPY]
MSQAPFILGGLILLAVMGLIQPPMPPHWIAPGPILIA